VVRIAPLEARAMIDAAADDLVVIDVRTPAEYATGHVAGAVNFDLEGGQFTTQIKALPRDANYIVYCQSGRRSALAARAMVDAGFTHVHDLGGLQSWIDDGLPVVTA
jgi:rhodanese-related sulfurtransferase